MTTQKATPCEFSEGHCIHCGDSEQSCAFAECEGWINPGDVIALMRAELTRLQYEVDAIPAIKEERDDAWFQNTELDARCAKLEAAAKLALEALHLACMRSDRLVDKEYEQAIMALRQAGVQ